MFVGRFEREIADAVAPTAAVEAPGSPVVIPTRMADITETGVPQLIQGSREEEAEIREEQMIPPKGMLNNAIYHVRRWVISICQ